MAKVSRFAIVIYWGGSMRRGNDVDRRTGDCCADTEPELHAALLENLFAKRGTVLTAAEFAG